MTYNCALHGQNMPDACICHGARYWMDRALTAETRATALNAICRLYYSTFAGHRYAKKRI